jgi:hypothetical protein
MNRSDFDGVDAGAIRGSVERALQAMDEVRRVKGQLTGAKTSIDTAYEIVQEMATRVRGHLDEIDALARAGDASERSQLSLE